MFVVQSAGGAVPVVQLSSTGPDERPAVRRKSERRNPAGLLKLRDPLAGHGPDRRALLAAYRKGLSMRSDYETDAVGTTRHLDFRPLLARGSIPELHGPLDI